jgi:hypothetical protein
LAPSVARIYIDRSCARPTESNGEGGVFLEYDESHHVLYSSNFEGGLWRIVKP